jgi:hypothetical protein
LLFRPLAGINDVVSVGIARAKNEELTPAGEKFCEILRKASRGQTLTPNLQTHAKS